MDKVIIDGVDVSGCEFSCENPLHEIKHSCNVRGYEKDNGLHIHLKCKNNPDCYYKQLQRLEQENNSLQAQLNNITVQSNNVITALEQENERLKGSLKISQGLCKTLEKAKSNEHEQWFIRCCEINTELDKYRQCLQEIKRIIIQEKVTNNKKLRAILDLITEAE